MTAPALSTFAEPEARRPRFKIAGSGRVWHWQLVSANGSAVAMSRFYTSRGEAMDSIESAVRAFAQLPDMPRRPLAGGKRRLNTDRQPPKP
jgi:uncharacterized protein YegP (UPF0339 family)